MVALLMERPFWDSDNLPMITLYCENAVMLVLLALGFNVTLTGQCCSGGLSGALLPLMDSIAGATAGGGVSDCFGYSSGVGEYVAYAKARHCPQKPPAPKNGAPTW